MTKYIYLFLLVFSLIGCSSSDSTDPVQSDQHKEDNRGGETGTNVPGNINYSANEEFSINNERNSYKFKLGSWSHTQRPDVKYHMYEVYNGSESKPSFRILIETNKAEIVYVKRNNEISNVFIAEFNSNKRAVKKHSALSLNFNAFYEKAKTRSYMNLNKCRNTDIWREMVNTRLDLVDLISIQLPTRKHLDPLFSHRNNGHNTLIVFDGKTKAFKNFIFLKQKGRSIDQGDWKFVASYRSSDLYENTLPYNSPKTVNPTHVYGGNCDIFYQELKGSGDLVFDQNLENSKEFKEFYTQNISLMKDTINLNQRRVVSYPINMLQGTGLSRQTLSDEIKNDPLYRLIQQGRGL